MKSKLIIPLLLMLIFGACKKDRLEGDYERLKGKYRWIYTDVITSNCALCSRQFHREIPASDDAAQIEFNDKGEVLFFINNEKIQQKRYKIKNVDAYDDVFSLDLKILTNKKVLDIGDKLSVTSLTLDTIYVDKFPGSGYYESFSGTNYFVRIK